MDDKSTIKKLLLLLPNLLKLLYRLLKDPRVSREDKIILGATVAYVVTPLDFVPDFIPFFGQVDDAYLVALALLRLLNRTDEAILREHWDGPEDLASTVKKISDLAVFFLPLRIRKALLGRIR